ncbi:uncharacterized protein LOC111410758 [Olea europaea var. sylvestris]|uniref:uncharacterized protein LOC111410758 n=1 Tax=Olea europaea var. sylvestris TaxID=158386 RepID=UPI000C1CDF79|nr:uncharacterized protein LOC111410758 [Olea europaea var. sylvestris]
MEVISTISSSPSYVFTLEYGHCKCYHSSKIVAKKSKKPQTLHRKDSEPSAPRITSNVKQNLQFLRLWKDFQKRKSNTPRPSTSYRKKKVEKEEIPEETELYRDPTLTLYYTNQGMETAIPVLLVDGYNVCGYWEKLKKHFMNGRLDIARQKLIDELLTFSMLREVKVVVVFDAMMSGLPTHKENFSGIDIVYSSETCADAWIEKEVKKIINFLFYFILFYLFIYLFFIFFKEVLIQDFLS